MATGKPSLEEIVTRYRRELTRRDGSVPELEIRMHDVDYANWAAIYAASRAKRASDGREVRIGDGALVQMVSAVKDAPARGAPRVAQIREIYFVRGKVERTKDVSKEPLLIPYRAGASGGLPYIVALAAERADAARASFDETALIRVKVRVSFPLRLPSAELKTDLEWRIDMTITRQITGSDASALKQIRDQMFATAPPMTADNVLAALRLDDDANPAARQLYRYEVEAEFVGPPDLRDGVRPADVTAAADTILRLANPGHLREAAMQAEIYRAAQYLVKAPGYLSRFAHELGLKRLLPQALAITRADWREIYPPRDFYLTEKADGKRALAIAHDGRGVIVADALYDGFGGAAGAAPAGARAGDTILDGEFVAAHASVGTANAGVETTKGTASGETTGTAGGAAAFYAFDAIVVAGRDVSAEPFEVRLGLIAEGVAALRALGVPASAKAYTHIADDAPAYLEKAFLQVYEAPRPYKIDGLILVEPGKPYADTVNYKWKPAAHNTIDVLARRAPASVLRAGRAPFVERPGHKLYFLFVGINRDLYENLGLQWCPGYAELFPAGDDAVRGGGPGRRGPPRRADAPVEGAYFPIQFAPSDAPLAYLYWHPDASAVHPDKQSTSAGASANKSAAAAESREEVPADLDGKIVEVRCRGACLAAGGGCVEADWEVLGVREDRARDLRSKRYFGNDFYTAELIWLNYVDPFPIEQLWAGAAADYFQQVKAEIYRGQTACISFAKTRRIAALRHADWVVDVGIGKGQDLGRYLDAEVQHLVAVDRDRAALTELVRRKYGFARPRRDAPARRVATTVHVLAADATEPFRETLDKLGAFGLAPETADALVCNLAVHYFLGSVESMRNFVALARGVVRVGGTVVLTILNGGSVHAAFEAAGVPAGKSWDIFEGTPPARKFSLKRQYASPTLEAAGQKIGVLLPFSGGGYYDEYLVNVAALSAEFAARGFRRTVSASIAEAIPEFEARNRGQPPLTPGDRAYLALYGELVFQRDA